jgi:hypothetical protein
MNAGQPCPGNSGTCLPPGRICQFLFPTVACDPALFDRPAVAIADLPGGETRLLDTLNRNTPIGDTPMGRRCAGLWPTSARGCRPTPDAGRP